MAFLKLVLAFAPWLAFLFISGPSMFRLKLGLIVAAVLVVVMWVFKLHRGVILWAGVVFFAYALAAVVFLDNMWTVRHMGILANTALAAGTWISVLVKKPFTLDYAREHTDPSMWGDPSFIKTNYILTCIWGSVFVMGILNAWLKMTNPQVPAWVFETVQYLLLFGTMFFTTWYPGYVRKRESKETSLESG